MLSETQGEEQLSATLAPDRALYNEGLAPVPAERRTWGVYSYASLWVAMSVCIPTYMLASGLIAVGMNWQQAILTILLGNLIVLIPMLLNAHAATKYGIPSTAPPGSVSFFSGASTCS
jgi:NCS1 family nucleobase:cation symporter-1